MFRWLRLTVIWYFVLSALITSLASLCPAQGELYKIAIGISFFKRPFGVGFEGSVGTHNYSISIPQRPTDRIQGSGVSAGVWHDNFIAALFYPNTHAPPCQHDYVVGPFAFREIVFKSEGIVEYPHILTMEIPCWAAVLALSTYPMFAFLRGPFLRWHRRRHNRCAKCAYSLAGLIESRCPECGTPILSKPAP
jgi:hypothetical protein